jgi:hypothetical protein
MASGCPSAIARAASRATLPRRGAGTPAATAWHPSADHDRRRLGSGGRGEFSREGAGSWRQQLDGTASDTPAWNRAGAGDEASSAVASSSGSATATVSID